MIEREVPPYVPEALRLPVTVAARPVASLADLATLAVDYDAALTGANCRILGVDAILRQAEKRPLRQVTGAGKNEPCNTSPIPVNVTERR